ncbi:MAG: PilN domain-containing protein [Clostridia bacterium]|nr:PilN domain-containing protein [Clostridia bacterium]
MKDLNLIPKSYKLKSKKRRQKVLMVLLTCAAIFLMVAAVAFPLQQKMKLLREKENLDYKVKETSDYYYVEKQMKHVEELYGQIEKEADRINVSGVKVVDAIEKIENSLPEGLFINNFALSKREPGAKITLNGVSQSENEIAVFVDRLRKSNYFESIMIKNVKKAEELGERQPLAKDNKGNKIVSKPMSNYNFEINVDILH